MFDIPTTTDEIRRQPQALAELIIDLPDGTEMAGNPLVGALLQGKDGYVPDPELYAEIFLEAEGILLEGQSPSTERLVTYRLEMVNGLRRVSGKPPYPTPLLEILDEVKKQAKEITNIPRRNRLLGLACYHSALLNRMAGRHEEAASDLVTSSGLDMLGGNRSGAVVSLFAAQHERFCANIAGRAIGHEAILAGFTAERLAYETFSDAMDANYREAQGPIHLVVDAFIAELPLKDQAELIARLAESKYTGEVWLNTITGPICAFYEKRFSEAIDAARYNIQRYGNEQSSSIAEAMLVNMLAMARAQVALGDKNAALITYKEALTYDRNSGGHWIKAVMFVEEFALGGR